MTRGPSKFREVLKLREEQARWRRIADCAAYPSSARESAQRECDRIETAIRNLARPESGIA